MVKKLTHPALSIKTGANMSRTPLPLLLLCLGPLLGCGGKGGDSQNGCGEVRACGGDVLGNWQVDLLCPDPVTATQLLGAQLPAACADAVESLELPSYEIALEYTATARSVTGNTELKAVLNLSPTCIAAATQFQLTLSDTVCGLVGSVAVTQLRASVPDAVLTCKLAEPHCACDLTGTLTLDSTVNYTVQGNQIVEGDTSQDYCVSGDQLALRSSELGQLGAHRQ
jgi:hypothetical protein